MLASTTGVEVTVITGGGFIQLGQTKLDFYGIRENSGVHLPM